MEILASLEIADYEVRLVVGEFHESRFNMLHLERVACESVVNKVIVNPKGVEQAIKKALDETHKKLGYRIYRVLLVIPSLQFERVNKRVNVFTGDDGIITKEHIDLGVEKLTAFRPEREVQLVNMAAVKFISNGISSRKMPIGEQSEILSIEADLLYACQDVVFDYVGLVERCGLEVLDICMDAIAFGEEAAIFEQSMDRYIVAVELGRQTTSLSLFYKGSLVNCEVLDHGYGNWGTKIKEEYNFSTSDTYRLLNNCLTFQHELMDDAIVHLWQEEKETKYLSERTLCSLVVPSVQAWIESINETCQNIADSGRLKYIVGGSGAQIIGLHSILDHFNAEANVYIPQTIGARNPALTHVLGTFYSYEHPANYRKSELQSVMLNEVKQTLQHAKHVDEEEGTFTRKLKKIFNG
ncbi:MAG: cell division protein FtsA [Erysipelotrichaceae bacterium]